jgi:hypothetical protein
MLKQLVTRNLFRLLLTTGWHLNEEPQNLDEILQWFYLLSHQDTSRVIHGANRFASPAPAVG